MSCSLGLKYLNTSAEWKGEHKFNLNKILSVLKRLEDPQDSLPSVHVAGTNGKGSVSATISSILGQAGYRVGLNISPHLAVMNERILLDGLQIHDDALGDFGYEVRQAAHKEGVVLSFHEAITAVAFLAFREIKVDWIVMEVGLGGRLDSSNVMRRPQVSSVVSIDYDHQHILGDTLEEIAKEKAGIIKPGVPVVVGAMKQAPRKIISEVANSTGSKAWIYGKDFTALPLAVDAGNNERFTFRDRNNEEIQVLHSLRGAHQRSNMSVALQMARCLNLPDNISLEGIARVHWPARLERLSIGQKSVILDAAHNPAGVRSLINFLESEGIDGLDFGFGVLDTKNYREMVEGLRPYVKIWRLLEPDNSRAIPTAKLKVLVSGVDIKIIEYGRDYERFLSDIQNSELPCCIAGSIYLVGKLRQMISPTEKPIWTRKGL